MARPHVGPLNWGLTPIIWVATQGWELGSPMYGMRPEWNLTPMQRGPLLSLGVGRESLNYMLQSQNLGDVNSSWTENGLLMVAERWHLDFSRTSFGDYK